MSTPTLLTLPAVACQANIIMTLTNAVAITQSEFTFEQQAFKWPGDLWTADFNIRPITNRADASEWIAFGVALEGNYGRFLMGDPSAKLPRGVASGSPQVDGANQTGKSLDTKGWTPDVTGILLKGDYIQLGSGVSSRLHILIDDVNSDSSGNATLSLGNALKYSPADSSAIVVNNPVGLFRSTSNSFSWSVDPGPVYRFGFSAVEVPNA